VPRLFVQPHQAQLPACVSAPVERNVGGDAEQPGGELRIRLVFCARAINADEHVLGQLLRDGVVANQAIQMADHRIPVPVEEQVKAGPVASGNLHHQGCIGIERERRRHADSTCLDGWPLPGSV
jgi:hypothetical protein